MASAHTHRAPSAQRPGAAPRSVAAPRPAAAPRARRHAPAGVARLATVALLSGLLAGCAFHTTAKAWNARTGGDGEPVFFTSTTKVGLNLFIALPLLGNTAIDGMVNELTGNVAKQGGDRVRIVQGSSENYWYGFPPLTWIFTPVISTVAADFRPSVAELATWSREWAGPPPEGDDVGEDEVDAPSEDADGAAPAPPDDGGVGTAPPDDGP